MTILLRLEHAAILALGLVGYVLNGGSWWLFAVLFLVPDLSMAAYLAGAKTGAIGYNIVHSWVGPALLLAVSLWWVHQLVVSIALIWASHIAFDRMLGYGLKHYSGFKDTHLGRIGRTEPSGL